MFPASSNMKLVLVVTILLVVAYEGEGFEGDHYQQILESRGSRLQNRFFGSIIDRLFGGGRNEPADNTNAYVVISPDIDQHLGSGSDWSGYPGNSYDDYYGGENRYRHPHDRPRYKQGSREAYRPPQQGSRGPYQHVSRDTYQQDSRDAYQPRPRDPPPPPPARSRDPPPPPPPARSRDSSHQESRDNKQEIREAKKEAASDAKNPGSSDANKQKPQNGETEQE